MITRLLPYGVTFIDYFEREEPFRQMDSIFTFVVNEVQNINRKSPVILDGNGKVLNLVLSHAVISNVPIVFTNFEMVNLSFVNTVGRIDIRSDLVFSSDVSIVASVGTLYFHNKVVLSSKVSMVLSGGYYMIAFLENHGKVMLTNGSHVSFQDCTNRGVLHIQRDVILEGLTDFDVDEGVVVDARDGHALDTFVRESSGGGHGTERVIVSDGSGGEPSGVDYTCWVHTSGKVEDGEVDGGSSPAPMSSKSMSVGGGSHEGPVLVDASDYKPEVIDSVIVDVPVYEPEVEAPVLVDALNHELEVDVPVIVDVPVYEPEVEAPVLVDVPVYMGE